MAELVLIYDSVTGGFISKQAGSAHIANAAITSALVASGAIGGAHLAAAAILSANIASGSIGSSHLGYAPGAGGGLASSDHAALLHLSGQIGSGQIGTFHIQAQGIASAQIATQHVGTPHIANAAITSGLIASGQVGTFHIAAGAIVSALLGSQQIGAPHILPQSLTSSLIQSGQIGRGHIGNWAIASAHIGSGQVGQPHIANAAITSGLIASGAIGGAHIANAAIVSAKIGANVIATPHIAAGGILSGALGAGTQDLALVGFRRPMVELGNIIISGTWDGTPQSVNIPSGYPALEVLATMIEVPTILRGDVRMQFSSQSGGIYHTLRVRMGDAYNTTVVNSTNSFALITSAPAVTHNRCLGRATIQSLADNRPCAFSDAFPLRSGIITSANLIMDRFYGYLDLATVLSGLTFWSPTSGAYASGSVIKVFAPTY